MCTMVHVRYYIVAQSLQTSHNLMIFFLKMQNILYLVKITVTLRKVGE